MRFLSLLLATGWLSSFGIGAIASAGEWKERVIGRVAPGEPLIAKVPVEEASQATRLLVLGGEDWLTGDAGKTLDERVAGRVWAVDLDVGSLKFPPEGKAYHEGSEVAHVLWRWMGVEGFGAVFLVSDEPAAKAAAAALEREAVGGVGPISVSVVSTVSELPDALLAVPSEAVPGSAAERRAKRRARLPIEVAGALSQPYGNQLRSVAYIPALAVVGRMRWGDLVGETAPFEESRSLLEPWLAKPLPSDAKLPGASAVSGHLVFVDWFDRTEDQRARERVVAVASHAIGNDGKPVDVVPNHNQMSDSVFMNPPLLAAAGRITGDVRYFEACLNHVRSIQAWCLRDDGIYRHSPLDEGAWGRGNGFPALGLALVLGELPESWSGRAELMEDFLRHLVALLPHQDETGMWHQVVDGPDSYREFTSTCMITFAMLRGMREGWLDPADFEEPAARAWMAIKERIALDGERLIDVCTGTGKQKNLEAYYDRTAILGSDDRGGAMALMVATERALWDRERR